MDGSLCMCVPSPAPATSTPCHNRMPRPESPPLALQSTLQPVHGSAVPPMVRATVGGYTVLLSVFLSVAVSGFWAFGTSVQVRGRGALCTDPLGSQVLFFFGLGVAFLPTTAWVH